MGFGSVGVPSFSVHSINRTTQNLTSISIHFNEYSGNFHAAFQDQFTTGMEMSMQLQGSVAYKFMRVWWGVVWGSNALGHHFENGCIELSKLVKSTQLSHTLLQAYCWDV